MEEETAATASMSRGTTLFVGNLSFRASEDDMYEFFAVAGPVTNCRIVMDRVHPTQSRGFGYVDFADAASASKALVDLAGVKLAGRPVRLDSATRRAGGGGGGARRGGLDCVCSGGSR